MADAYARIELHGGNALAYAALHEDMAAAGFSRTIVSEDGVQRHLPTATYVLRGHARTAQQVLRLILPIADAIDPGGDVLVFSGSDVAFRLRPVQNALASATLGTPPNVLSELGLGAPSPWDRRYGVLGGLR